MQSPAASPLERMRKLSIFRSKSDQSPSTNKRRISDVLLPSRSKASDAGTIESGLLPNEDPQASPLPLNPRSSVEQEPSSTSQVLSNSLGPDLPSVRSDDGYFPEETAPKSSSNAMMDSSGLDEHDMARRLMDVESSFLPDHHSPYQRPKLSTTDTALYVPRQSVRMSTSRALAKSQEQGNSGKRGPRDRTQPFLNGDSNRGYLSSDGLSDSQETPPMRTYDPVRRQMSTSGSLQPDDGDNVSSYPISKNQESSPTAAAVERSKVRATSGAVPSRDTPTKRIQPEASLVMSSPALTSPEAVEGLKTSHQDRRSTVLGSGQPTSTMSVEAQGQHTQNSASVDDLSAISQMQSRKSPTLSQTRQPSRHSSASSFHSAQAPSDAVSIADVVLSGEQTPTSRSTVRQSRELSRLPSFGSVASSISGQEGSISGNSRKRDMNGNMIRSSHTNLGRLAEEEKRESQFPETPQAITSATIAPTDTILAKHVRDVQVPNTVAKAYKASNPPNTLQKFDLVSTPQSGKGKNNLTLKEQNSRIDKLSKENFDLKLKIHYLYQALQDRSEEGVKEMITRIAQLQTDLIKTKKDNRLLRKRVRELERQHSTRHNDLSVPSSHREESEGEGSSASFKYAQLEDEIMYLRNQMQSLDDDNQKLRACALARETEKRRLIDQLRRLEATDYSNGSLKGGQSETWTALLDNEVNRREQAEREVEALAEELGRLKSDYSKDQDRASQLQDQHLDYAQQPPRSAGTTIYSGTTLVEQLKIENADLRRDLGAQTSMLTSRNRERERLQQEIEDLKMVGRKAGAGQSLESFFDRSISRANERPTSKNSAGDMTRQLSNADQEQFETVLAALRDDNAVLKMNNQDLHRELNNTRNTLQELESELADADTKADEDRVEAQQLIDQLEDLVGDKQQEISELELDLQRRDDEANTLRREIQTIKDSLNRVVEDCENRQGENVGLQRNLTNANGEIEALETSLREANLAKDRLEVQAESLRGEIAFLREEQESDKIKIGDLRTALRVAKNADRDNQERLKELEDLEEEISQARQEARQLKKALAAKDLEATSTRDKLEEVEDGLRRALGDDVGSSTSMLHEVIRLQRDFENTLQDHDSIKQKLSEKERLLKDREALLESSGLETRRLNDLLDKERQGRKHDQNEHAREKRNLVRPSELDTSPIAERKKLAHLESKHGEAIRVRDTLLLNTSTRLSALCGREWTAKHGLKGAATLDTIAASIPSVNTTISSALATLESSLPDLKSRIRSTERHLVRDYTALEKILSDRSARLDDLEKILTTNQASIDSTSADSIELARIKDENRHLKRELKFLKQGSFALPGLPSPQDDLERVAPRGLQPPSPTHANTEPNILPPSREKHPRRVDHRSDLDRQLSGGSASGSKNIDEASTKEMDAVATTTSPRKNQHLALQHSTSAQQPRQIHTPLTAGEQTMMLKLQGLQRQLTAEREGRILDRKGARTRLKEGEGERERLKAELANEKARSRARGEETGGASSAA